MPYTTSKIYFEVIDEVSSVNPNPETIIFNHGIGADSGIWQGWFSSLVDRYRIITFDLRGYGRSQFIPKEFEWSLDQLARDVVDVADAAEIKKMHLVGESIGGTIALNCGIRFPERFSSITISNGGHVGASINRVEAWDSIIKLKGIKAWSDDFMVQRFYDNALTDSQWAWYSSIQEKWTQDSIMNLLRVLVGTDLRPELTKIMCPTLILHPDNSPFIPVEVAVDLYRMLSNAQLQVFARARHGLPFSHARSCSDVLRQFLTSLSKEY